MTPEQLNVLTPDAPAAVLLRAITEYERDRADIVGWPYPVELTDEETDTALEWIY